MRTHTHTAGGLSVTAQYVGGLARWRRERLTPGLPKGKRRSEREKIRALRRDRHLSARCAGNKEVSLWNRQKGMKRILVMALTDNCVGCDWNNTYSVCDSCSVALSKFPVCVFGLSCLSSCYIHNTKTATYSLTLALFPSLLLFVQTAIRAYSINQWWPPVKTCPVNVCLLGRCWGEGMKQVVHTEEQNTGSKCKVISLHCLTSTKNALKMYIVENLHYMDKSIGPHLSVFEFRCF